MNNITLIEEDTADNEALCIVLERSGFSVNTYVDEPETITAESSSPDLFIIDRNISRATGFDLCRRIKSLPPDQQIPVIMISATPDIATQARAAGADIFMEKPFSKARLLDAIQTLLPAQL